MSRNELISKRMQQLKTEKKCSDKMALHYAIKEQESGLLNQISDLLRESR